MIPGKGFQYQWAKFLPNQMVLVGGAYPGEPLLICEQNLAGDRPHALSGVDYMDMVQVASDGSKVAGVSGGKVLVYDLASGEMLLSINDHSLPVAWNKTADQLFLFAWNSSPYRITKLDLASGKSTMWKTIKSVEPGFAGLAAVVAAPEANAYVYSTEVNLSRLYVVDGWS